MAKNSGMVVRRKSDGQLGIIYNADVKRLKDAPPNDKRSPVHLVSPGYVPLLKDDKPVKVLWNVNDYKIVGFID